MIVVSGLVLHEDENLCHELHELGRIVFFFVIIRETCPERSRRIVVEELSRVGTVRADAAHSRREMNHNIRARIAQQAADGVAPR